MFIYNGSPSCICYFFTANFSPEFIYFYIIYYPSYIFVLQGPSSVNELIFYARGLDHPGRIRRSSSGWSDPPIGRTSPPTNWLDCSALTPTRRSLHHPLGSSHGLHRQLCQGLASYARDSSMFGFFVQASPAKLGTPVVVRSFYVSSVCYQVAPCCSY